ncbi:MAG: phosphoribosylaminoimidazolecarboxamide formyltransferase / cyclohydrolase [Acidobacteriota bacterium]|jgi:phosphoribosylaminoimidazolecarboxamide formyltransferase/IMP cyclohydrolase|nr:phosphoribosylaminoimidazolecarboxamide formyltransferase / cyclohydrolase [Acidobacteriota bacterium]
MDDGLRTIRRALLSVSDKTGLIEFARGLQQLGVELISTGGTAIALRDAGIEVREISDVTGSPEMMDGRVKTLHPAIHGALLAQRDNPEHRAALAALEVDPIDLVVVNLYPFEETISRDDVTLGDAIEQIDIGGPAMIRSAAKNYRDVAVITSPELYERILSELNRHNAALTLATRGHLARLAFMRTAQYDSVIFPFLSARINSGDSGLGSVYPPLPDILSGMTAHMDLFSIAMKVLAPEAPANGETEEFVSHAQLELSKVADLRYGENPHQSAALYELKHPMDDAAPGGVAQAELLSGKEMSFNNYIDADAAWALVSEFDESACAIVKHTNPSGVGIGATVEEAYRRALATDPVSAFGGIVGFNHRVDGAAARAVIEIFTEVVIAPGYDEEAMEVLRSKKNLRVLLVGKEDNRGGLEYKTIAGGMLVQSRDTHRMTQNDLRIVSLRTPTAEEVRALLFGWIVCKHTKSNAIVYASDGQTVGIGAGQMSRIDSVKLGAMRAHLPLEGSVLASDAFFPFRDGVDEAARYGITAIIQPGGSVRDQEVIDAANQHDLAMAFTGIRHFKH